jgi:hypothetical protein
MNQRLAQGPNMGFSKLSSHLFAEHLLFQRWPPIHNCN